MLSPRELCSCCAGLGRRSLLPSISEGLDCESVGVQTAFSDPLAARASSSLAAVDFPAIAALTTRARPTPHPGVRRAGSGAGPTFAALANPAPDAGARPEAPDGAAAAANPGTCPVASCKAAPSEAAAAGEPGTGPGAFGEAAAAPGVGTGPEASVGAATGDARAEPLRAVACEALESGTGASAPSEAAAAGGAGAEPAGRADAGEPAAAGGAAGQPPAEGGGAGAAAAERPPASGASSAGAAAAGVPAPARLAEGDGSMEAAGAAACAHAPAQLSAGGQDIEAAQNTAAVLPASARLAAGDGEIEAVGDAAAGMPVPARPVGGHEGDGAASAEATGVSTLKDGQLGAAAAVVGAFSSCAAAEPDFNAKAHSMVAPKRLAVVNPFAVAAIAGAGNEGGVSRELAGLEKADSAEGPRVSGLARFRAPMRPPATGKLESFDRRIGRGANALQEVQLHSDARAAGAGAGRSYLPAWLSAPLGGGRSRRDSADSGSTTPATTAGAASPTSADLPTGSASAARPPLYKLPMASPSMRSRSGSAPPPGTHWSAEIDAAAAAAAAAIVAAPALVVLGSGGSEALLRRRSVGANDLPYPTLHGEARPLAECMQRALARRLDLNGEGGGPGGGSLEGLRRLSARAPPLFASSHPVSFAPFPTGAAGDAGGGGGGEGATEGAGGGQAPNLPRRRRSFPALTSIPSLFLSRRGPGPQRAGSADNLAAAGAGSGSTVKLDMSVVTHH